MKKVDVFSKVLDLLDGDEKDKLLASAKGLLRSQKVVCLNSSGANLSIVDNSKKRKSFGKKEK